MCGKIGDFKMWMTVLIMVYLVPLGIWDYQKRKVPIGWLVTGQICLCCIGINRCVKGNFWWTLCIEMLPGIIPGVLLLLLAWCSGKAGYADGIALAGLGMCLGYQETFFLFGFSLFLLSLCSIGLLFLKKVHKNTKMPYLSFLALTYLIKQLLSG